MEYHLLLQGILHNRKNQCCLISGESGAGTSSIFFFHFAAFLYSIYLLPFLLHLFSFMFFDLFIVSNYGTDTPFFGPYPEMPVIYQPWALWYCISFLVWVKGVLVHCPIAFDRIIYVFFIIHLCVCLLFQVKLKVPSTLCSICYRWIHLFVFDYVRTSRFSFWLRVEWPKYN